MSRKNDPRHEARRLTLAKLFARQFLDEKGNNAQESALEELEIEQYDENLHTLLYEGVLEHLTEIDAIVQENAPEWSVEQIDPVDLACLRLGVFELIFAKEKVPLKVAIDEAIELAKEFGGENSGSFINGVLGTIVKKSKLEEEK